MIGRVGPTPPTARAVVRLRMRSGSHGHCCYLGWPRGEGQLMTSAEEIALWLPLPTNNRGLPFLPRQKTAHPFKTPHADRLGCWRGDNRSSDVCFGLPGSHWWADLNVRLFAEWRELNRSALLLMAKQVEDPMRSLALAFAFTALALSTALADESLQSSSER